MKETDKGLRKQERNDSKIFQCLYQKMQSKPANTSAKHKSAGLISTLPVCWAHEYLSHRKREREINPLRPKSNQTLWLLWTVPKDCGGCTGVGLLKDTPEASRKGATAENLQIHTSHHSTTKKFPALQIFSEISVPRFQHEQFAFPAFSFWGVLNSKKKKTDGDQKNNVIIWSDTVGRTSQEQIPKQLLFSLKSSYLCITSALLKRSQHEKKRQSMDTNTYQDCQNHRTLEPESI